MRNAAASGNSSTGVVPSEFQPPCRLWLPIHIAAGTRTRGYHPSMSKVSLAQLATLKFPDLTQTESSLLEAVENGHEADATSPSSIRAEILEWLCTNTVATKKVHRHGMALRGYS